MVRDYITILLLRMLNGEHFVRLPYLVGFFGDQASSFNACGYIDWYTREYDTLSINCYPESGMSSLTNAQYGQALSNEVKFFLEEPALCIDRSDGDDLYEVRTTNYIFKVRKFLFIGTSNDEILQKLSGNLIEEIKEMPLAKVAKSSSAVTVQMQWDPNQPAWWYDVVDKTGGTYSFRTYGDLDCFARMEFVDTPSYRQHNALKVVYSDSRCIAMWKELIEDSEATGNYSKLKERVLRGLSEAFPESDIPEPVLTKGKYWDIAWHFNEPLSTATNEEVEEYAINPTDNEEDAVCLIGESWGLIHGAWVESAFVTSRNCLIDRFSGSELGDALNKLFSDREGIVADYYENDPEFSAYPGEETVGRAFPILGNEHFAPFGCLYKEDGSLKDEHESGRDCGKPACVEQGVPVQTLS
mmetsp:Transcript_6854/g.15665  ORF Transcript_6854/g.15665 Transcript_6854/m.15665 type:complete len:413 (-) Transcript_6854:153-1391(-)